MMWANINHCVKKLAASGHGHGSHNGSHHQNGRLQSNVYPSLGSIPEDGVLPSNGDLKNHGTPSEASELCNGIDHDTQYKSNFFVYADCHASSRGLFGK